MFVVLVRLHADRSQLASAMESQGQKVSRAALLLGTKVGATWMAHGSPEAA